MGLPFSRFDNGTIYQRPFGGQSKEFVRESLCQHLQCDRFSSAGCACNQPVAVGHTRLYGNRSLCITADQQRSGSHFPLSVGLARHPPALWHPTEFSASLNRLGVPYKIAYAVSLTLRYLPEVKNFISTRNEKLLGVIQ